MAIILDGESLAAQWRKRLAPRVARLAEAGRRPGLATILVGDDPASQRYIARKHADCAEIGIASWRHDLPVGTTQDRLQSVIAACVADAAVHGVLVQLPLPLGLDSDAALDAISPAKDVDGLHPINLGRLVLGRAGPKPCTPRAVLEVLRSANVPIAGRHAVVIGRGPLVGRGLALLLASAENDAAVTVVHRGVADLAAIVRTADIVIAAAGVPDLVTAAMVKPGAAVIGVGITATAEGVVSDIADDVAQVAQWVTPRHGAIGPMTRAMLLANCVEAAEAAA